MTRDMRWPANIEELDVKYEVLDEISMFYNHVGYKYINTYGREEINKLIRNNFYPITQLNKTKLLSDPILDKWKGMGRVVIGKWNFAIDIQGNTVIVVDACHKQNMTNNPEIQETYAKPYSNPRISNIQFPTRLPDNPYFIRAEIDGDWQGIRKITREEHERGQIDLEFAVKLAEKCYNKELNEKRFDIDEFVKQGRKP